MHRARSNIKMEDYPKDYCWYLVYTKPHNEDKVCQQLSRLKYDLLNPKISEKRYVKNRLRDVISPLFPCYIFVKFEYAKDYRMVKYGRGVRNIVGFGNEASPVPEEIIASISEKATQGVINMPPPQYEYGEDVVICKGPFEGLDAVFIRKMDGMERVSVLLKAMNVRLVIDSYSLHGVGI